MHGEGAGISLLELRVEYGTGVIGALSKWWKENTGRVRSVAIGWKIRVQDKLA